MITSQANCHIGYYGFSVTFEIQSADGLCQTQITTLHFFYKIFGFIACFGSERGTVQFQVSIDKRTNQTPAFAVRKRVIPVILSSVDTRCTIGTYRQNYFGGDGRFQIEQITVGSFGACCRIQRKSAVVHYQLGCTGSMAVKFFRSDFQTCQFVITAIGGFEQAHT